VPTAKGLDSLSCTTLLRACVREAAFLVQNLKGLGHEIELEFFDKHEQFYVLTLNKNLCCFSDI
jgi:hypothetical protein